LAKHLPKSEASSGAPKRSSGERSETERSEGAPEETTKPKTDQAPPPPDPEVLEKAQRRRYTAEYKLQILKATEACTQPGEIGEILRREGLYFSHLRDWKQQRLAGTLWALEPKKRGPKAKEKNPLSRRVAELESENRKLKKRLEEAQIIIEFQKKVADVLGIPLKSEESSEKE
jgi:transposase-like protein